MFDSIRVILAIAVILFAALLPLALVAGFVGHGMHLAKDLGGPLEYDIPDAEVYGASKGLSLTTTDPGEAGRARMGPDSSTS